MRSWFLTLTLLFACEDQPPAPIAPGTPSSTQTPSTPLTNEVAVVTLSCMVGDGTCIQCASNAACYSPTMEDSCRANGDFANEVCSLDGAIGRCLRPDSGVVVFYGGPPRNHQPEIMQQLCENGFRGVFEAL